jgi:hypothetical protein
MNPFTPNKLSLIEEQFVFGEGGANSGVHKIEDQHPIIKGAERIKQHNVNSQRTYRNRYREDYNENMRELYKRKYGKDADDNEQKERRLEQMRLINQNYRLKKTASGEMSEGAIQKNLDQRFREAVATDPRLNKIFSKGRPPKKGKIGEEITKALESGITFPIFKKQEKLKFYRDNRQTAIDSIIAVAKTGMEIVQQAYKTKFGNELSKGDVYKKNADGKRVNYQYVSPDYEGLQLYNDKDEDKIRRGANTFLPRSKPETNKLLLDNYYTNVLTTIKPEPLQQRHKQYNRENKLVDTGTKTKFSEKRKNHRNNLGAYEWDPSTSETPFKPKI